MSYKDDLLANHNQAVQTSLDRREARVNLANQAYQQALNYGGEASEVADALDELHVAQRELREVQAAINSAYPQDPLTPKQRQWMNQHPTVARDPKLMAEITRAANIATAAGYKTDSPEWFSVIEAAVGNKSIENPIDPNEVLNISSEKFKLDADTYNRGVTRLEALKRAGEYK